MSFFPSVAAAAGGRKISTGMQGTSPARGDRIPYFPYIKGLQSDDV
jgi:hypothetical protein